MHNLGGDKAGRSRLKTPRTVAVAESSEFKVGDECFALIVHSNIVWFQITQNNMEIVKARHRNRNAEDCIRD
jgi:hypothetical protein